MRKLDPLDCAEQFGGRRQERRDARALFEV